MSSSNLSGSWHPAIIELFEIDLSTIGSGYSGIYKFTNDAGPGAAGYTPFPIEARGFEVSSKGSSPQPSLTIANVLGTFSSAVTSAEDLVGAKVTRKRVLAGGGSFNDEVYYIIRKTAETNMTITWDLGTKIDLEGLQLPRRVITQDYCVWKYKGPECGYGGGPVGTASGALPTASTPEGQDYVDAVAASSQARAVLNTAQARLVQAQRNKDAKCSSNVVELQEETFSMRRGNGNGDYSFLIEERGAYFAAYANNQFVPESKFRYSFSNVSENDAVEGETQNTGRGEDQNETGDLYKVGEWTLLADNSVALTAETFNPPSTFGMVGLDNIPIIIYNGTVLSADQIVDDGSVTVAPSFPPTASKGDKLYVLGERAKGSIGPVRSLSVWGQSSGQCNAAIQELQEAQDAFDEAVDDAGAASSNLGSTLANVPPGDSVFATDDCGKTVASCRLRFGSGALPFGGFPGSNLPQ